MPRTNNIARNNIARSSNLDFSGVSIQRLRTMVLELTGAMPESRNRRVLQEQVASLLAQGRVVRRRRPGGPGAGEVPSASEAGEAVGADVQGTHPDEEALGTADAPAISR